VGCFCGETDYFGEAGGEEGERDEGGEELEGAEGVLNHGGGTEVSEEIRHCSGCGVVVDEAGSTDGLLENCLLEAV